MPRALLQMLALLLLLAGTSAAVAAAAREPSRQRAEGASITSDGPLTEITVSPTLGTTMFRTGEQHDSCWIQDCLTVVAVRGELYGPAFVPSWQQGRKPTPYTPISQRTSGRGTIDAPFRIHTEVALGDTGLRVTQVDSYVVGDEDLTSRVYLHNDTATAVTDAVVYRAGFCYQGVPSNSWTGLVGPDRVGCVSPEGRLHQWTSEWPGATRLVADFVDVWRYVSDTRAPFPDACACDTTGTNGLVAGLSWQVGVPPEDETWVQSRMSVSGEALGDADGDGLPGTWEQNGYDRDGDGVVDVDLPAMGADPRRKDVFVEVDWMLGRTCVANSFCLDEDRFEPDPGAIADVVAAFAAAPVANPDGSTGITLHVDHGPDSVMDPSGRTWGALSRSTDVPYTRDILPVRPCIPGLPSGFNDSDGVCWLELAALQQDSLEPARADVFRWALYADVYAGSDSSGIAAGIPSSLFVLTGGAFNAGTGFTAAQEASTFMHELGHTLALQHGGADGDNRKPNYRSQMSYSWQNKAGVPLDYSRDRLPTLDENDLTESIGVPGANGIVAWMCASPAARWTATMPGAADWDCDGTIDPGTTAADVNGDGRLTVLAGHDDWAALQYAGGEVGAFGASDPDDDAIDLDRVPDHSEQTSLDTTVEPGAGVIRSSGVLSLVSGVGGQELSVDVHNPGAAEAAYVVGTAGLAGVPERLEVVVPAGATTTVPVPVDSDRLRPGVATWALTLTSPDGSVRDTSSTGVRVFAPSDPVVAAALEELQDPVAGVGEDVRATMLDVLEQAVELAPAVVLDRRPRLTGRPMVGSVLRVRPAVTVPTGARATYRWSRGTKKLRASGPRYRVTPRDAGAVLAVRITWSAPGLQPTTLTLRSAKVRR
ncbi:unannotated protein [freshwater metagenome]|uniref:Unannotated protein n=1 Tax=freshwater metagenome TaxID=449393 RepID=A0A6J6SID7_9ZZZZ|nr:hypothetical protein [Actinomycetota bacterium]